MERSAKVCKSNDSKKEEEKGRDDSRQVKWGMIQELESSESTNSSMESSFLSDSETEDSSSSSSSASASANGPLFHLSELMNQLPIRRGLSKHYEGKSQSFTSLAEAMNDGDLAKKDNPYGISSYRRMKSCKSYAGFDGRNKFGPKATITKKSSRSSFFYIL